MDFMYALNIIIVRNLLVSSKLYFKSTLITVRSKIESKLDATAILNIQNEYRKQLSETVNKFLPK